MKLIDKIKEKVKAKLARLRAKLKVRAPVLIAVAVLSVASGCQQLPSRSQQLTFDRCVFSIVTGTNIPPASIELATQAMAIDTAGNESQSADASASADYSPGRIDSTVAE